MYFLVENATPILNEDENMSTVSNYNSDSIEEIQVKKDINRANKHFQTPFEVESGAVRGADDSVSSYLI